MRRLLPFALGALAFLTSGCLSFNMTRNLVGQPRSEEALAVLRSERAEPLSLEDCLASLGAPDAVREYRVHGLVLAYAYEVDRFLGFRVSVPVTRSQSASFAYTDGRLRTRGVVLWFDRDWRLLEWREGQLSTLLGEPQPPVSLEDIES